MIKRTEGVEVPPEEPEFECGECGKEITDCWGRPKKCKECGLEIDLGDYFCHDGEHYCNDCGEEIEEKEKVEEAEKLRNAPIPG